MSTYLKAPFGYPGGKLKSLDKILPFLPMRKSFVEVFGGTGVILMNRQRSKNEVFNDKHSGITAFYKCLQDSEKIKQLEYLIEYTVHSREFWEYCKDTWKSQEDVNRAFRWFYMTRYSFSQMGRNFGRSTKGKNRDSGKLIRSMSLFKMIHFRLRQVLIENQSFEKIIKDFDSSNTVFYLDPPYLDTSYSCYEYTMTLLEHRQMLDLVFDSDGFFAVSGYEHPMYEEYPWDSRRSWSTKEYVSGNAISEENHKPEQHDYKNTKEVLWVKR